MSNKQELIKAIQQEYAKVAKIDEDAETIYNEVKEHLRLHTADPIVLSSTSGDAAKVKYLAQRYAERYGAIAALLEQLDEEQKRAHLEWRGIK